MTLAPTSSRGSSAGGLTLLGSDIAAAGEELAVLNIPQTHTHLMVFALLRGLAASSDTTADFKLNASAGVAYDRERAYAANTAITSLGSASGSTGIVDGDVPAANGGANNFGSVMVWLPYYRGSTGYRTGLLLAGSIPNTSVATFKSTWQSGVYRSTGAITRIDVIARATGGWTAGSLVEVYGI